MTTLSQRHNFSKSVSFYLRSNLLIVKRFFANLVVHRPLKFSISDQLASAPVIAYSESELWNKDDNKQNWILTAGKVQNLRITAEKLNGLEIPANTIFSFWKHIGKPSTLNGYVVGREIREGCMIPTIAGGLCQLSNALYDAALKAGFEIIERHKHTQVISGSLAESDRDATVKWNYIDLRFKSPYSFKIVIDFTAQNLLIQFRGNNNNPVSSPGINNKFKAVVLNDCYSCGNLDCHRNPAKDFTNEAQSTTTFILDEKWPEFDEYVKATATGSDYFIIPFSPGSSFRINRFTWNIEDPKRIKTFPVTASRRAISIRAANYFNSTLPPAFLKYDNKIVANIKRLIPIETTHIVISQNLLPFAWQHGILWGRTFDVLMTRLPMEKIHERLNKATLQHGQSKTLNDFRANDDLINLENLSLTKSRHIITPHQEIANIFQNKSVKLEWRLPDVKSAESNSGKKILFPASALARKGAYEVRQLARELNLTITISGKALEDAGFWNGVNTQPAGINIFEDVGLVILPTYIEHQPRLILKALAMGIPVITTPVCGISEREDLTIVPAGDYEAFKDAVLNFIS